MAPISVSEKGNGNGGFQKIVLAGGLLLLGYTINSLWTLRDEVSELKGRVQANAQLQKDVSTALSVLQNHGEEFEGLRSDLQSMRGESIAWRSKINEDIKREAEDIFRKAEWLLEKQRIAERHAEFHRRIDDLEALHQRAGGAGGQSKGP